MLFNCVIYLCYLFVSIVVTWMKQINFSYNCVINVIVNIYSLSGDITLATYCLRVWVWWIYHLNDFPLLCFTIQFWGNIQYLCAKTYIARILVWQDLECRSHLLKTRILERSVCEVCRDSCIVDFLNMAEVCTHLSLGRGFHDLSLLVKSSPGLVLSNCLNLAATIIADRVITRNIIRCLKLLYVYCNALFLLCKKKFVFHK